MFSIIRRASSLSVSEDAGLSNLEKKRTGSLLSTGSSRRNSAVSSSARGSVSEERQTSIAKVVTRRFVRAKRQPEDGYQDTNNILGVLFASLPTELQLAILAHLPLATLLPLRQTSRHLAAVVDSNAPTISRHHLAASFPPYVSLLANTLPPPPFTLMSSHPLFPLASTLRAHRTTSRLSIHLADFIAHEYLRKTTTKKRRAFAAEHARLAARMRPLLYTLDALLTRWRLGLLAAASSPSSTSTATAASAAATVRALTLLLPPTLLLRTHHMHALLSAILSRCLRPPSYASAIERGVRGWTGAAPSVAALRVLVACGGAAGVADVLGRGAYADKCRGVEGVVRGFDGRGAGRGLQGVVFGPFGREGGGREGEVEMGMEVLAGEWWGEVIPGVLAEMGVVEGGVEGAGVAVGKFVSELLGYDMLRGTPLQRDDRFRGGGEEGEAEVEDGVQSDVADEGGEVGEWAEWDWWR